ncbi:CutA1 divalent ion tolerance protein [Musa troglodytarum]|uniref:CutA1 divalent ion tolerance protein n=1 Tax=Musa troglodytarum TaxID=320322 RepID=A0A9E7I101_9LILI|nr:CutA1 divalent ion tolerance protein [Musa troglodytarum]URE43680.1 CutA1 divalent ion tolerance protein [Musa troglodytarum]
MSLQSVSRAFWALSSSATPTRRSSSAAPKLLRRRAPLVGALSCLCLGSIYAIAYRSAARFRFGGQNPNSPIWDPIPGEWSFVFTITVSYQPIFDSGLESLTSRSVQNAGMIIATQCRLLVDVGILFKPDGSHGAYCVSLAGKAFRSCILYGLARSKFVNQPSTRGLHSTGMEGALTTVPSIVVYVTVPNKEAGMKLAESIIKEKLAACVNRVPGILLKACLSWFLKGIESVYWWDGKVERDAEELLIIKTRESLLGALTQHVKSNHEYDVPEVIALPITGGNEKYLQWIKDSTRDK